MGCCSSSLHSRRRYRDPADLDEVIIPMREFGNFRNGTTNLVPDDIDGLPSTHIYGHLATDPDTLLYEAEIDQGRAYRCARPMALCVLLPHYWVFILSHGLSKVFESWTCDEICCWVRKEYSTRTWFRVYPNRIEVNNPHVRIPWGLFGCGSWSGDQIVTHPFDRGAFGFRPVRCGVINYLCGVWPVYGQVVARQRCPCNGSLWPRILDCGGWWCDEWICDVCFCSYRYFGLADSDETSIAAGLALQAYFEGRVFSKEDIENCLTYWRENVSEMGDPVGRKRDVCCNGFQIPCCSVSCCYEHAFHPQRNLPYETNDPRCTPELIEVYEKHDELRVKQIQQYKNFTHPVKYSSVCRAMGCRRVFGRRGFFFCTEGCCDGNSGSSLLKKSDEPAPPFRYSDIDDENDASVILQKVLGDPPPNVRYQRWQWDGKCNKIKIKNHADQAENRVGEECSDAMPLVNEYVANSNDSLTEPLVTTKSQTSNSALSKFERVV